jgi:hypothetical protein
LSWSQTWPINLDLTQIKGCDFSAGEKVTLALFSGWLGFGIAGN